MLGELSEDSNYISMPFEDVRRLVATMKMAEAIVSFLLCCDRSGGFIHAGNSARAGVKILSIVLHYAKRLRKFSLELYPLADLIQLRTRTRQQDLC